MSSPFQRIYYVQMVLILFTRWLPKAACRMCVRLFVYLCVTVWRVCTFFHDFKGNDLIPSLLGVFPLPLPHNSPLHPASLREPERNNYQINSWMIWYWFNVWKCILNSLFLSSRCVEEVRWTPEPSSVLPLTPRSSWVASTTGNRSLRVRTELTHTHIHTQ